MSVQSFRPRSAFTLIELMIVLAIIVALAALGIGAMSELLPRFKTRKAALQFKQDLENARLQAIMNNREAKVEVTDYDPSPDDVGSANYGAWEVSVGNKDRDSTSWDVLPFEGPAGDSYQGEGKRDISKTGELYMKGVALEEPDVDEVIFTPRGWVANDATDFSFSADGGDIQFRFTNKAGADKGLNDYYVVKVYRGGMVRVENGMNTGFYENKGGGTGERSSLP